MNGRRAREIRRVVYGDGGTGRVRRLTSTSKPEVRRYRIVDRLARLIGETVRIFWRGTVMADPQRRLYQQLQRVRRGQDWRMV